MRPLLAVTVAAGFLGLVLRIAHPNESLSPLGMVVALVVLGCLACAVWLDDRR